MRIREFLAPAIFWLTMSSATFAGQWDNNAYMLQFREIAKSIARSEAEFISKIDLPPEIMSSCIFSAHGVADFPRECWITVSEFAAMLHAVGNVKFVTGLQDLEDVSVFYLELKRIGTPSYRIAFQTDYGETGGLWYKDPSNRYLIIPHNVDRNLAAEIGFDGYQLIMSESAVPESPAEADSGASTFEPMPQTRPEVEKPPQTAPFMGSSPGASQTLDF